MDPKAASSSLAAHPNKPLPTDVTDDDLGLLAAVRLHFARIDGPLFTTDATGLWDAFLAALPSDELRRTYACYACRRFVETYGGLALIDGVGALMPAMWGEGVPVPFLIAAQRLSRLVCRARVTGVFLSEDMVLGTPETGPWQHFAVTQTRARYHRGLHTAGQRMAELREDHATLCRALPELGVGPLRAVVNMLRSGDALYRSEKVLGPAEWLLALQERRAEARDPRTREHLTWLAVATAPPGYCHPRSTMIGTILEDLAGGLGFEDVRRRFAAKMHPLQYQRPQAPPAAGQIVQAEKVVAALGITGSLRRRYARLEDVTALWLPTSENLADMSRSGVPVGVFGHLTPRGERVDVTRHVEAPESLITWEKFRREVLPGALAIEAWLPAGDGPYVTLTTAADPEAPPILQWDDPERRNPVAWYVWNGGSPASQYGLAGSSWVVVSAVCLLPPMWGREAPAPHWGEGAILILGGAIEMRTNGGLALFPEILRGELHGVRATIEAHSRASKLEGEPGVTGLDLRKGSTWDVSVRVMSRLGRARYRLERWD